MENRNHGCETGVCACEMVRGTGGFGTPGIAYSLGIATPGVLRGASPLRAPRVASTVVPIPRWAAEVGQVGDGHQWQTGDDEAGATGLR